MATASSKDPIEAIRRLEPIECGEEAAKCFVFDPKYRNLNHGSFGTFPKHIRTVQRHFQDQREARPDQWIRYDYPQYLDESREAVAKYLHAPTSACVFVSNASVGLNTILRNIVFKPNDVIVYFATVYGSIEKTLSYIAETTPAESRKISYTYPVSDDFLCDALAETIKNLESEDKNPKIAIFDTIVSQPGVRMPFERLMKICKQYGVLSCIDGAHGVGHIPINLGKLDPDFWVSNCHKWLFVPRGCAILYVPDRNQHLMRSTLPTSHGFAPLPSAGNEINNPLPPTGKSDFVTNFEFVGTLDDTPYLCVPAALEWRKKLTWNGAQGDEAVLGYLHWLAHRSGVIVSSILGTTVLENEEKRLGKCAFSNVRLPLSLRDLVGAYDVAKANEIGLWIQKTLVKEYDTSTAIRFYGGSWWMRLSAQIYLTEKDFEQGAEVLKEVCQRVRRGEWHDKGSRASKL